MRILVVSSGILSPFGEFDVVKGRMKFDRSDIGRGLPLGWGLLLLAALLYGCPTYEDDYSGTYREVLDDSEPTSDALEIDFFRFGDNAAAIVRLYNRDPITGDPFGEESHCVWTTADAFDEEDRDFGLDINRDSSEIPEGRLLGEFVDEELIETTLYDSDTEEPHERVDGVELRKYREEPNSDCEVDEEFVVEVEFPRGPNDEPQRMPPSADYDIENPVLAISWLGVQSTEDDRLVAVNRHQPAERLRDDLNTNFDPDEHGLKNERPFTIPPPPDAVRMSSGDTRMALGHFSVVDDDPDDVPEGEDDDWQFSWNTEEEKLVGSSLQHATRPECEDSSAAGEGRTSRWGSALLYVERDPTNLSTFLKEQITGLERCESQGGCDSSFFLVDICASDEHVLHLFLREDYGGVPRVPILVTDAYLDEDSIPLPPINPFAL
ncbi:MAG: hypothetical protein ACOCV2_04915 [Persicimonas sp.]